MTVFSSVLIVSPFREHHLFQDLNGEMKETTVQSEELLEKNAMQILDNVKLVMIFRIGNKPIDAEANRWTIVPNSSDRCVGCHA